MKYSFQSLRILNSKFSTQILATIITQLLTLSHGIGLGWLSPTLHNLQNQNSSAIFPVTIEQASWIGSLYGLGALFGNVVFAIFLDRLGRKWCLYLLAVPHMLSWVLIFFSKSCAFLYVSRFLTGITGGGSCLVISIFISEIADPSIRGILSSMSMLFMSIGILIGYAISTHLDYYLNPCLVIILPIVYLLATTMLPETPQHLLRRGQVEEARRAYDYYRNTDFVTKETTLENIAATAAKVQQEFQDLKNSIIQGDKECKLKLKDFVDADFLKAFTTAIIIVFLNQFSGIFAFFNYMSTIFAESGTNLDPNTCTIIMGVVQIAGTLLTLFVVDRFGRKLVMLVSTGGMAVGLFLFSIYARLASGKVKAEFCWIPLVLMIFTILIGSVGILGLVFTLIVEILPIKMRSIGCSICMGILSIMVFVALKLLPLVLYDFGLDVLLFSCGSVCVFCWFYLLFFQKETKGIDLNK